jgi:hypothetical protein
LERLHGRRGALRAAGSRGGAEGVTAVDLFAVQPRIGLDDYLTEEAFAAHHRALAERIAGLRTCGRALAVWPEEVATVLDHVFEAPSLILGPGGRVLAQARDPRAEDVLHVRV